MGLLLILGLLPEALDGRGPLPSHSSRIAGHCLISLRCRTLDGSMRCARANGRHNGGAQRGADRT
eukprot:11916761-Karenia_brevis.AAC.1